MRRCVRRAGGIPLYNCRPAARRSRLGAVLLLGWLPLVTAAEAPAAQATTPATSTAAPERVAALGRAMFFDAGLSASGKLACATCHDPRYAYGPPPGKALALGGPAMDQGGTRAVPSLRYLRAVPAFTLTHRFNDGDIGPAGGFTWDGRAASLAAQARLPLFAANEMANRDVADLARRLARAPYAPEFKGVFGAAIFADPERAVSAGLEALAAFQATPAEFFPYTSKYDAFLRGEVDLTEQEERGVALFKDPAKGNCASCHVVLTRGGTPPVFTDYDFLNIGVPRNPRIAANRDPHFYDQGLCGPDRRDLAAEQRFCGYFRAPGLRNVAIRDAFFHNGVFGSLEDVMHFYVERDLFPEKYYSRNADGSVHKFDDLPPGAPDNVDRDAPLDRAQGAAPALTDAEIDDLIAFLGTLTDGYRTP